ncbi:MAG: BlaI/MecI/CopY family transcriptional regulator [Dorea sp.]|nr:BlaI/MecI/CopY family transcriptional regulator [Dorea sp.]
MPHLPHISEAEFEVMKVVWRLAPVSTNEITNALTSTTAWSPKTIQTLIKRLVNKRALSYEKQGRMFVYTPLIEEKEYASQQSRSFLKRFYDGDITAMLSAYVETAPLSEAQIDSLRSLLVKDSEKGGE